jgi:DNA-binding XRE family transcriptional regulator
MSVCPWTKPTGAGRIAYPITSSSNRASSCPNVVADSRLRCVFKILHRSAGRTCSVSHSMSPIANLQLAPGDASRRGGSDHCRDPFPRCRPSRVRLMASTRRADYRRVLARLKSARVEAGLTQSSVARLLGRPQSYVSKSETGERRLDVLELAAFARVYGRPLDHFVSGPRAEPKKPRPTARRSR